MALSQWSSGSAGLELAGGRGLSLPVTAEGVASDKILEALKSMGDLKGQGYLYGQPEDAATTRARLAGLDLLADGDGPPPPPDPVHEEPIRQAG